MNSRDTFAPTASPPVTPNKVKKESRVDDIPVEDAKMTAVPSPLIKVDPKSVPEEGVDIYDSVSFMSFDKLKEHCEYCFLFFVLTFITLIVSAVCCGYFVEIFAY